MEDCEIEQAVETLKRLLQQHRECQFGRIEGIIRKGHIEDLTLHREEAGIRKGKSLLFEDTDC